MEGSDFLPFKYISFSFATLQASGKTPWDIDELQILVIGFDKTSALSNKRHPEGVSMSAALDVLIFKIIFTNLSS